MRINRKWFFGPNLPRNGSSGQNFENLSPDSESTLQRYHVCQFSSKTDNFEFFDPKVDFGLQTQKTNVGIRINILETPYVPVFRQNRQLWLFRPKFAQKWILGSEFQKSKSGCGISTSMISCANVKSKRTNLKFSANAIFWF